MSFRGLIAVLSAALLCAVLAVPAQGASARLGDLEVSPGSIDLGNSDGGVAHLTLKNVGTTRAVRIVRTAMNLGSEWDVTNFRDFIEPGQSVTIDVTFNPKRYGYRTDTVEFLVDQSDGYVGDYKDLWIPVSAYFPEPPTPIIDFGSPAPDFGSVEVGETKTLDVYGGANLDTRRDPLYIDAPTFSNAAFTSPDFTSGRLVLDRLLDLDRPLNSQNKFRFIVRFAPTTPGIYSEVMTLVTDEGTVLVPLSATAVGPELSATPATFSRPDLGASSTTNVTVENTGTGPARIASVQIAPSSTGEGADDFASTSAPSSIAAGASGTVSLAFTPSRGGVRTAVARLLDAGGRVLLAIPLSAQAAAPMLQAPGGAAFGLVKTGRPATRSLTVKNTGDAPLVFRAVNTSAPFSVSGDTAPLPAGASRTLQVGFSPTTDGDASGEVILETNGGDARVALTGSAASSVALEPGTALSTGGARPSDVATGDVDEDGRVDVVVGFAATGAVGVARGRGDGAFEPLATVDAADTAGAMGLATGDLDADGHLDLVVAGPSGTRVFLGRGDGTFTRTTLALVGDAVAVGDLDDDGDLDLASTSRSSARVRVWRGAGDGTFAAAFEASLPPGSSGRAVLIADVDRDGDLDIAASWTAAGSDGTKLLQNAGTGTLTSESASFPSFNPPLPAGALAAGQFTADLLPDLTNGFRLRNGATGAITTAGAGGEAVAVLDLNGDGRDDQVTASHTEDLVHASFGDGSGGFSSTLDFATGSSGGDQLASLATGDLNGDGRPDVVAAKGGEQVDVLLAGSGPSQAGDGKVLISEVRFGGDGYVQVINRSRSATLRLDGWELRFPGGRRLSFPAGTRVQPGGVALATTPLHGTATPFSLASLARGVVGMPAGAAGVMLVDASGSRVDAVGLITAPTRYREGSGLTPTTFRGQGAYVRRTSAGALVDTDDNSSDLLAIDTAAQPGDSAALGSPRPDRYDAPTNRNDILQSSLLDPNQAPSAAPNREKLSDDTFVVRRTLTNCSGGLTSGPCVNADKNQPAVRVTRLRFRVTELTTIGTSTQAQLAILPMPSQTLYSYGMKLLAPSAATGGGLNATLSPVVFTGLNPGESIDIEFTLKILRGGSFRFGYTTEDDLEPLPAALAPPAAEEKVPDAAPAPEVVKGSAAPPPAEPPSPSPLGTSAAPPTAAPPTAAPPTAAAPTGAPKKTTPKKPRCVTRKQLAKLKGKARKRAKLCRPKAAPKRSASAKRPTSAKR